MADCTRIELPQSGGKGITILSNGSSVAVDGTDWLSMRIPISGRNDMFSNAGVDSPDKQLVIELIPVSTRGISMKISVIPRGQDDSKKEELFLHPQTDISAEISFEIKNRCLSVKAHGSKSCGKVSLLELISVALSEVSPVPTE